MYIVDGICYAGEKTESIKISEAKVLRGGMLPVGFSTGEKRLFDTTELTGSAFTPLKDEKVLSATRSRVSKRLEMAVNSFTKSQ